MNSKMKSFINGERVYVNAEKIFSGCKHIEARYVAIAPIPHSNKHVVLIDNELRMVEDFNIYKENKYRPFNLYELRHHLITGTVFIHINGESMMKITQIATSNGLKVMTNTGWTTAKHFMEKWRIYDPNNSERQKAGVLE